MTDVEAATEDVPTYRNRWSVLFCGLLCTMTFGTVYSYGNLAPYLTSYLRKHSSPSIRYRDASWIYTAEMVGISGMMPMGGYVESLIGPKWTTLLGGSFMSLGVLLSFWTAHRFSLLLITYGLFFGAGIGIAYSSPLGCAMRWWPRKKGMASGVLIAGYGIGPCVFNLVQTVLVNPGNRSPSFVPYISSPKERYFDDDDVLNRVPTLFLLLSLMYFSLQLIGASGLVFPPESSRKLPPIESDGLLPSDAVDPVPTRLDRWGLVRSPEFSYMWSLMFICGQTTGFIASLWKVIGSELPEVTDMSLAYLGSAAALANAGGRLFWGWIADHLSAGKTLGLIACISAALHLSLPMVLETLSLPVYSIWICGIFLCIGGSYGLFPVWTSSVYGAEKFVSIYGLLFTSQGISFVVVSSISSWLFRVFGWNSMIYLLGCFQVCSVLIVLRLSSMYRGKGL